MTDSVRVGFVMEQTLGHVTHYRNLREGVASQPDMIPTWLPIRFDVQGPERLLPLLRSNWSVRASWRARRALDRALSHQPLDALFFHTQVTALFSRSIMQRVPAVISLDATPLNFDSIGQHYRHRPASTGLIDRRKYEMNRATFRSAAALVAWSEWAKRSLANDYGVDDRLVHVIAPGAASVYFELGERRTVRRPRLPGERVRLLFVGGDFVRKGGPLLLECMRGSLGEQCQLEIVTEAYVAPQPHVRVHNGLAPNSPELRRLFADADIFVLPTHADCLALVLMEAAAAGLPVVATTVGALGEAFVAGETGLVVPRGKVPALAAALSTLVNNGELRQRMAQAAYAFASRKFDARRNNRAVLDLVTTIAQDWRATGRAA